MVLVPLKKLEYLKRENSNDCQELVINHILNFIRCKESPGENHHFALSSFDEISLARLPMILKVV